MSSNEANHTNSGATWQGALNNVDDTTQAPFNGTPSIPIQQSAQGAPIAAQAPVEQSLVYDTSGPLPIFPTQSPGDIEDMSTHPIDAPIMPEEDFELPESVDDIPVSRMEILAQIGQYISLVLAPLLFGGLTCLFVLPLVANGRAKIPPEGLWPLALVIIAIAIGQGVAVYYAGSNNALWALSTVGAFFLFILVGCFAIFGLIPGFFLLALFIVLAIVVGRFYIRIVPQGVVDMVYLFGKYNRTLYPGLNILLPWEKIQKRGVKVTEQNWASPLLRVQMSRTEDIEISAAISYQLIPEDAYIAVTQVDNWEASLQELFNTTIKSVATSLSPDDLLAWQRGLRSRLATNSPLDNSPRWEQINNALFQSMRDKAALRGIQVNWVHVRDVRLMPHNAGTPQSANEVRPSNTATTQPDKAMPGKQSRPAAAPSQPAAPAAPAVDLPKISNEALETVLTKAYREVRNGKITDPNTIRHLAQQFEAVARDPEKNKHVNFDAARAARNLYEEAEQNELLSNSIYNDETKTDWNLRQPSDENTRLGG